MSEMQEVLKKMDAALCRIPVQGVHAVYMGEALMLLARAMGLAAETGKEEMSEHEQDR